MTCLNHTGTHTDLAAQVLIAFIVQMFYGWRISALTEGQILAYMVWSLSLVSFGASSHLLCIYLLIGLLVGGVIAGGAGVVLDFNVDPAITLWLAAGAICDILITGVLVFYLVRI